MTKDNGDIQKGYHSVTLILRPHMRLSKIVLILRWAQYQVYLSVITSLQTEREGFDKEEILMSRSLGEVQLYICITQWGTGNNIRKKLTGRQLGYGILHLCIPAYDCVQLLRRMMILSLHLSM